MEMRKILHAFDQAIWWALAVLMGIVALTILVQVTGRIVFNTGLLGAEEISVLLFGWIILVGSAYHQKADTHLSIDSLRSLVTGRAAFTLDLFRLAIIVACSLVVIWQGVYLTWRTIPLLYPTTEITRAYLYASVPVGFAIGLIYLIADVYNRWLRR